MSPLQHHRAFQVSAAWTLFLLLLGSVVHATGSSLACPDWPTCYGTMVPAMEGGVFWEHLHRLVAGGLILMWLLAGWLMRQEGASASVRRGWAAGLALLIVQAVFGGVTVLLQLPAAVSTTHLALAFLFLGLTVTMGVATSPHRGEAAAFSPELRASLRRWAPATAAVVFAQSLLGGLVRHLDAGMACPDVPLCLGRVVPPLAEPLVVVHYLHRVAAVATAVVVLAAAAAVARPPRRRGRDRGRRAGRRRRRGPPRGPAREAPGVGRRGAGRGAGGARRLVGGRTAGGAARVAAQPGRGADVRGLGRARRLGPGVRGEARGPPRAGGGRLSTAALGDWLARLNAVLNFTSFALLVTGLVFIKRRNLHAHRRAMTAAVWTSGVFLVSYLTRVAISGTHRFAGTGAAKAAYLGILFSHIVLAIVLVPLVLRLLWLVRRRRFRDHAAWARRTYPIWLYVSVTGILVYVLLYQVYGYLP